MTLQTATDLWIRHPGLPPHAADWPPVLRYVKPTWMLGCDPPRERAAVSWRLPLGSLPVDLVSRLGDNPGYIDATAWSLDAGWRLVQAGYIPLRAAVSEQVGADSVKTKFPVQDEVMFLRRFFPGKWLGWAVYRILRDRRMPWQALRAALAATRAVRGAPALDLPPGSNDGCDPDRGAWSGKITVLLPTLDRYEYLDRTLLGVSRQTIRPLEVVCVDQTESGRRRRDWPARVGDVPLVVIQREQPGQCTSRNAGIRAARGEYILFLDDDIELPEDLIERHVGCLVRTGADASCGVAEEFEAGPLPAAFLEPRVADVFPTNNTLLRKSALGGSGLFDEAYERGSRADHDLGMRLYLSGAVLYLNPEAKILHYHAPRGGLRTHGARVVTRGKSRQTLTQQNLPSATEIYLWKRYFPSTHVEESLRISRFSVLGSDAGSKLRRIVRTALGLARWPRTSKALNAAVRAADALFDEHPTIPPLSTSAPENGPEGGRDAARSA